MLFHVSWEFIDTTEEAERRSLDVFAKWQPPAEAEFKGFYGFAEGTGGVAIIEVPDAATLARTLAPFSPWLSFTAKPIIPVEDLAAISGEAITFRDSIA